ncbi:transposase family protein [Streptomyces sp. NPDC005263]|uniref:transposase family protein n=1 Tax=Streptomyces sp. NPDC005263 TaxID=3364711 RepID=UPI003674247C
MTVRARWRSGEGCCPNGGCPSARVHDRYRRQLRDVPPATRRVRIVGEVRRLVCANPECESADVRRADAGPDQPLRSPHDNGRLAARLQAHHALVHGVLDRGMGIRAGASHLRWGRHTVQRYARAEDRHQVSLHAGA